MTVGVIGGSRFSIGIGLVTNRRIFRFELCLSGAQILHFIDSNVYPPWFSSLILLRWSRINSISVEQCQSPSACIARIRSCWGVSFICFS